jgi:hypothetical protein
MRKLLILLSLCLSSNAKELLEDPGFKKFNKTWFLKKKSEYNYIKKPNIKKGVFSIKTTHKSEPPYINLHTELDLKAGKTYELKFSMHLKGDGEVRISYYGKGGNKIERLGLLQKISVEDGWRNYTCTFTANEMTRSKSQHLGFQVGAYKGEFSIKNLSLKEVAKDLSLAKTGKLTESE